MCQQGCPPCKTASGDVPLGTIAYRREDAIVQPRPGTIGPPGPQHGILGSHFNLYQANQNPKNCQCFWKSIGAVSPQNLPANAIPIEPFL